MHPPRVRSDPPHVLNECNRLISSPDTVGLSGNLKSHPALPRVYRKVATRQVFGDTIARLKQAAMRYIFVSMFMFASTIFVCAQGPCTEAVVKQGNLQMADDAFSYMPPFGKPVSGKGAIQDTAEKKFAGRTNIKHSWEADRRIVASTSGDMAYEHGTMDMSYDEDGKPHQFKAVMLNVYKAKGGVCERVAGTMQPLEEDAH